MPANTNGRNPIDDEAVKAKIPVAAKAQPCTSHFRQEVSQPSFERVESVDERNQVDNARVGPNVKITLETSPFRSVNRKA